MAQEGGVQAKLKTRELQDDATYQEGMLGIQKTRNMWTGVGQLLDAKKAEASIAKDWSTKSKLDAEVGLLKRKKEVLDSALASGISDASQLNAGARAILSISEPTDKGQLMENKTTGQTQWFSNSELAEGLSGWQKASTERGKSITDIRMEDKEGISLLKQISENSSNKEGAAPLVSMYHEKYGSGNSSTVITWEPGTLWGGDYKARELPMSKTLGRRITLKDIREESINTEVPIEDILKMILSGE